MNTTSVRELIDFAIREEREAHDLYVRAAGMVEDRGALAMLLDMAGMEKGHENRLMDFKEGKAPSLKSAAQTRDLKIGDYLLDVKLLKSSTIQEVLIFAIKSEMKSHALYTDLAGILQEPAQQDFMKTLAEDELQHKNDLENLYDDFINKEN